MDSIQETKKIISEAKNIYLIPKDNLDLEATAAALALFYTLKELGKNVNLIIENFPENLNFLTPSLDFISYPKNFTISIPKKVANVSQIYYEKNDEALKIHLTVEKGVVKKDDISFYFSESKPDLIITLKIKDYQAQLKNQLDSFGFLLDSPILNIDSTTSLEAGTLAISSTNISQNNKNFGKINLINNLSLTEIVFDLIKSINNDSIEKISADCLLTGLISCTDNFKNANTTADVFEKVAYLMKKGADLKNISKNLSAKDKPSFGGKI
jgi:hypothetical protein